MAVPRNQIFIGSLDDPDYYFENDEISSASTVQAVALVGQELSIDTFSPVVRDKPENYINAYVFQSSDGKEIVTGDGQTYVIDESERTDESPIVEIQDGTPIWYFHKNNLVGKFYIDSIKRQAKSWYKINTVSAIGRLSKTYHGGGLFQRATFESVLRHILASGLHGTGSPIIEYSIDDDVAELTVSGWLPYASKRNNLYQLIFANGINIVKNADGNPRFTFIYTAGNSAEPIADTEIFQGGNVEYTLPYSSVSIMEHTYSALFDIEPVVLYDNTESTRVENEEIWFDQAPVIVSTLDVTEGLTIVSSTENSAIITGNGKLIGIPYTHTTRTVSRANNVGDREKTASVTDCTMVNVLNSENLLNRLFAFYCPPNYIKKITNNIVYTEQRCGKTYAFLNPYREREVAHLASLDIRASSFNRASCEFYVGYDPVGQAGLYQNCIILDKDTFAEDGGTFVVPQEILEMENPSMRVMMIGGGTGGNSGAPGEDGKETDGHTYVKKNDDISSMWYGGEGGSGGSGGNGGSPGRVKAVTIDNPSASYSYTIGDGGDGGEAISEGSNVGSDGTASTFSTYSTADEEGSYVPVAGVYNPIYGEFYALKGNTGIKGGQGGARKIASGDNYIWATDGENVTGIDGTVYQGGKTGEPLTEFIYQGVKIEDLPECDFIAYGGNGAGAAVGVDRADYPEMDGQSDQDAYWTILHNPTD